MEHNNDVIIDKKTRIMTIVKKFREGIVFDGHKNTEREIIFFEKAIKFHEEHIIYLNDRIIYLDNLFNNYVIKNNTDQVSSEEPIINSTFVNTPSWLS